MVCAKALVLLVDVIIRNAHLLAEIAVFNPKYFTYVIPVDPMSFSKGWGGGGL